MGVSFLLDDSSSAISRFRLPLSGASGPTELSVDPVARFLLSAAALCGLCGREIVENRAEHYRRHLENAQAYLQLVEGRGGDPSWSATSREWIERCSTMPAELEAGTVK
jgi:hypothetical protein